MTAANTELDDLRHLSKFMTGLHADQEKLREIQVKYDHLTLLGQMLSAGTDITGMREDFHALANVLLGQLATELHNKAILNLKSNARIAIDVLTRNLFERTADIGFLATDGAIRDYAQACAEDPAALQADDPKRLALKERFREYVLKYSVYHDIILLAPDGSVLLRLDDDAGAACSKDPLIAQSLSTGSAYVETFRPTDLLPKEGSPLVYSYRVMARDESRAIGVLCLCFRFQDECQRIFKSLLGDSDWTVITILDAQGEVIASSDVHQCPIGARLAQVLDDQCRVTRFAGREYLATTQHTQGYQGYMGPGWQGHGLAPLNHAFEMAVAHEIARVPAPILAGVLETATLFSAELRAIPVRAASIQRELNRAVWNGNVWLSTDSHALSTSFAKVLLREIGNTGVHTLEVFSRSTSNLYKTVVSSVLYNCSLQAALAIDIMDRNLYERANDCRWWALTGAFREALGQPDTLAAARSLRLSEILAGINHLYTVYHNILIFDRDARIVAASNPSYSHLVGTTLQAGWVMPALALDESQKYVVSSFEQSQLYDGAHTYVYAAAIPAPEGANTVGGIAIVFDSTPQFKAMLVDALPRNRDGSFVKGAFGIFADRKGKVIASTDDAIAPETSIGIGEEFFDLQPGEGHANIIEYEGKYFAVGSRMSCGYREYKGSRDAYRNDVVALVMVPLSERIAQRDSRAAGEHRQGHAYTGYRGSGEDAVDVATFYIGNGFYGVRLECELEAVNDQVVTRIPDTPEWMSGCIVYKNEVIPIIDLAAFLPGCAATPGAQQIIVVGMPQRQVRFGILVDRLGGMEEIPRALMDDMPANMGEGTALIESLVKPETGGEGPLLMILAVENLAERLARTGAHRGNGTQFLKLAAGAAAT